ncbi:MAG: chemotaxis protein CheX [Curvibacter sp.]|nr:chemotaxis protein CheX [Curvibacter sp.]
MPDPTRLEAKVLLLEHDAVQYEALMAFCAEAGLVALPRGAANALATLAEHEDLAGVLLAEDLPGCEPDALGLARSLHRLRPELPTFFRRSSSSPLQPEQAAVLRHVWSVGDLDGLRSAVERAIFSLRYPSELVKGIIELTTQSLNSMFPYAEVSAELPYVVHDRIIYGEVSTLIPIESTWCRGYMMLQTEENSLRQGLIQGLSHAGIGGDLGFRELNNLLGETTNLIWGAFKNRYIPPHAFANAQIQVPLVINHQHKYMSFGSQDPQLCIRYTLSDPQRPGTPHLLIVQRFIFNLLWSPEGFAEFSAQAQQATPTGELELF